jgi:tetracycline repressor-like protein
VTPETLRAAERGLTLLVGAGFPVGRALDALNALTLFVVAHAASEVSSAGDAVRDEVPDLVGRHRPDVPAGVGGLIAAIRSARP